MNPIECNDAHLARIHLALKRASTILKQSEFTPWTWWDLPGLKLWDWNCCNWKHDDLRLTYVMKVLLRALFATWAYAVFSAGDIFYLLCSILFK